MELSNVTDKFKNACLLMDESKLLLNKVKSENNSDKALKRFIESEVEDLTARALNVLLILGELAEVEGDSEAICHLFEIDTNKG